MAAIEAERLSKTFGMFVAANEITFRVEKAEIFGFLGPNGAGKTTTINMLTTLIPPTSGNASVAGFDIVTEQSKVRENIGLVPQDLTCDAELTGMESLMLQAAMYGMPKEVAHRRASELLSLVGLREVADRRAETYSGGMMKRLEIVAGLIHFPKILFLDEPTLGLDVRTRSAVWDYVLKLRDETGLTVIMTTHYMEEADRYCDRVAIMHHGRIMAMDEPSKLKQSVSDVVEVVMPDKSTLPRGILANVHEVLEVRDKDGTFFITVSNGDKGLASIVESFEKAGLKPNKVSLLRASLDSAFLELTQETMSKAMEESFNRQDFRRRIRRLRA